MKRNLQADLAKAGRDKLNIDVTKQVMASIQTQAKAPSLLKPVLGALVILFLITTPLLFSPQKKVLVIPDEVLAYSVMLGELQLMAASPYPTPYLSPGVLNYLKGGM